jgi:hypothetical protein
MFAETVQYVKGLSTGWTAWIDFPTRVETHLFDTTSKLAQW